MQILYIDASVREESRTRKLAEEILNHIKTAPDEACPGAGSESPETFQTVTLRLQDAADLLPLNRERLAQREAALAAGDMEDATLKWARQFKEADLVLIAAPYYDLSFPSLLKIYFENICAVGLTFAYREDGMPYSLCRAKRMIYVSTCGGMGQPDTYGYGYAARLFGTFFEVKQTDLVFAESLDLPGFDPETILADARDHFVSGR